MYRVYIRKYTPLPEEGDIRIVYRIYVGRCHLGGKILLEEREKGGKYERKRKKDKGKTEVKGQRNAKRTKRKKGRRVNICVSQEREKHYFQLDPDQDKTNADLKHCFETFLQPTAERPPPHSPDFSSLPSPPR